MHAITAMITAIIGRSQQQRVYTLTPAPWPERPEHFPGQTENGVH